MGRIGPTEIILLFILFVAPIIVSFVLGYFMGKKSGYLKRIQEEEKR
ncbi:MAG: hypothetical protein RLZZ500_1899 [Bacteroidota bacterium]|jgi:hypothetical protein